MHTIVLALTVTLSTAAQTAARQDAAVMSAVNQFVTAFNQGDAKAVAAACSPETAIIDEFPPHEWHGANACAKWMSDFDADAKKNGITDGVVTLGKPRHLDVTGDLAYVVIPADYAYKMKGKPMKETGSMFTVVLRKAAAGWRIAGWSWAKN